MRYENKTAVYDNLKSDEIKSIISKEECFGWEAVDSWGAPLQIPHSFVADIKGNVRVDYRRDLDMSCYVKLKELEDKLIGMSYRRDEFIIGEKEKKRLYEIKIKRLGLLMLFILLFAVALDVGGAFLLVLGGREIGAFAGLWGFLMILASVPLYALRLKFDKNTVYRSAPEYAKILDNYNEEEKNLLNEGRKLLRIYRKGL